MSERRLAVAVTALNLVFAPAALQAQSPPASAQPGRIEQDVTRPREPAPRDPIVIERPLFPEQVPPGASDRRFVLRGVDLRGNRALSTEELAPLWQSRLGSEVTVADAFALAEAITVRYRDRGYILSQAIVAQQDLPTGGATLQIDVVEGFIDKVRFTAPAGMGARLLPLVEPIQADRPLRLQTLERYLLLLNERAGITARANLSRSASVAGASDLEIQVSKVPAAYSVSLSNRSSEALGEVRAEGSAEFRDVAGQFDRHTLRAQTSGDKRLNFVSYTGELPIGREGFKASAGVSASRSEPRTAAAFELDTRSDTLTISTSYPFQRSRRWSLDGRATLHAYNNGSDFAAINLSRDRIRALRIGLTADHADDFGGINLFDVELSKGLSALGASEPGDATLSRTGADPQFSKSNLYAARLQRLSRELSALVALSAQYSDDVLVTAEQFGLGGETFLRAFDSSEVIGDRGVAGKLELRWTRGWGTVATTLYGFIDRGKAQRLEAAGGRSSISLRSVGVGLRASVSRLRGFVELAKPGMRHPVATGDDDVRVFAGIGADF